MTEKEEVTRRLSLEREKAGGLVRRGWEGRAKWRGIAAYNQLMWCEVWDIRYKPYITVKGKKDSWANWLEPPQHTLPSSVFTPRERKDITRATYFQEQIP
uniref:Uncharacterized protein n=1 Tax=Vespula pensylvanica TaxID=30213 RepID=A0A834P6U9_VESPE|nr:hypothetical protein H0235_004227 [Vespula pensylvanica]